MINECKINSGTQFTSAALPKMALFSNWNSMSLILGRLEGVLCFLECGCTISHQEVKSVTLYSRLKLVSSENAHFQLKPNKISVHRSRPLSPVLSPNLRSFHTQQALSFLNKV